MYRYYLLRDYYFNNFGERVKLRILIGCIVFFLVSMAMSCKYLGYAVWGKTVDAQIVRVD